MLQVAAATSIFGRKRIDTDLESWGLGGSAGPVVDKNVHVQQYTDLSLNDSPFSCFLYKTLHTCLLEKVSARFCLPWKIHAQCTLALPFENTLPKLLDTPHQATVTLVTFQSISVLVAQANICSWASAAYWVHPSAIPNQTSRRERH